jgi:hypothetical protein
MEFNNQRFRAGIILWSILALGFAQSWSAYADELELIHQEHGRQKITDSEKITDSPGSTETGPIRYIIIGTQPSVASYRGGIDGYETTMPAGTSKFDMQSAAAIAYRSYLQHVQADLKTEIETALGRPVPVVATVQVALNAMVVELEPEEVSKLSALPGIESIHQDRLSSRPQSISSQSKDSQSKDSQSKGPAAGVTSDETEGVPKPTLPPERSSAIGLQGGFSWIHAPALWYGDRHRKGTQGEGVVIGVIDTGINPTSPSFAATGGDGYTIKNPRGHYYGVCDPTSDVYDKSFPCNDKLIGAWGYSDFAKSIPKDPGGHGARSAGVAAGNIVYGASMKTYLGQTITRDIAGVAPHANVISYRACNDKMGCSASSLMMMIDQAIQDGVDVINYSIGAFPGADSWAAFDAKAFLSATDAGIFVAVGAGNSGPGRNTIDSPAGAPWVTGAGSTTQQVIYKNFLVDLKGGDTPPPRGIFGLWLSDKFGPAPIISGPREGNPYCKKDQFTQDIKGAIVVCLDHKDIADEAYYVATLDQGAGALILIKRKEDENNIPIGPGDLFSYDTYQRKLEITYQDGQRLLKWLETGTGHTGRLTGTHVVVDRSLADILDYFSSRGPLGPMDVSASLVKPNLTAPGSGIFAPSNAIKGYAIRSGTSLSAPQVAGGAALLHALHPTWTPMEIQSAMMTTAYEGVRRNDGVTPAGPFDMGAGRLSLDKAARAGLVLNETRDNFVKSDPYTGGDPATLNLASFGQQTCVLRCTWQRTVTNGQSQVTYWVYLPTPGVTVTPQSFGLAPGESQRLTVTADVSDQPVGQWTFSNLRLKSLTPGVPDAHFPIAARSASSNLVRFQGYNIKARQNEGEITISGLKAHEVTDAQVTEYGLTKSTRFSGTISFKENSDDGEETTYNGYVFKVPAGAKRLVAEITQTDSTNLDILVGKGDKVDLDHNIYAAMHQLRSHEYLNVAIPADTKTIWVAVRGYRFLSLKESTYQLDVAALKPSTGDLAASVPGSVPAGEAFTAKVHYQLPDDAQPDDHYYGAFSLGTDSDHTDNLGTVGVNIVRQ